METSQSVHPKAVKSIGGGTGIASATITAPSSSQPNPSQAEDPAEYAEVGGDINLDLEGEPIGDDMEMI